MAKVKSFPNNQDEYIGAEYVMKWLHGRTSGVFAAENNAAVSAVQNEMSVTVSDGTGWMSNAANDGVVWWNDEEAVNGAKMKLSVDPADSALNRIDRVIVEWKTTNYVDYPEIKMLKGSASSTPVAPGLTNNSTVRQISLARISVPAGTTAIGASMVTDERLDASVCGIVTDRVRIDTSTMQKQFAELIELIEKNLGQIMDDQIADKSITVLKLAKETVNYINAKNLLDNSDFTNPVNQRGLTRLVANGSTYQHFLDRWLHVDFSGASVTFTLTDEGVKVTNGIGYFYQRYEKGHLKEGISYTLAVYYADGAVDVRQKSYPAFVVSVTSENYDQLYFTIDAGKTVSKVALYEGEYTIDNLPEYQPKGYAVELLNCQVAENNGIGTFWEKVWENGSPTSSMKEGAKATVVGLGGYDLIAIKARWSASAGGHNMYFGCPGEIVNMSMFATTNHSAARTVNIDTVETITFNAGSYDGNTNASYMIPLEIYGIKGVKK